MTHISFITRTLSILAVALMFTGTAQAQTQDVKITTAVVVQEKTQVCVYKISGSSENMAGMVCNYCTKRVETALLDVEGIISVDAVDYSTGTATVTIATESEAKELIPAAIAEVNFVATLVEEAEEAGPATSD
ncbi:MAG: cation transporter [Candidatus Marinimicrobia bacterium]|nr:cation transporter [Candidatus Neomarinimicrobiota bacterium]